ncbi:MAG: AAA family ATPase [Syntrophales bacterium]
MFTEIGIENFKAFGKMQRIPLKPITLLYGPNSSGKSSLLQSLLMLKQTLEESDDSKIVLLPKGNLVDLGGYQEFIHGHDANKDFHLSISFKYSWELQEMWGWIWDAGKLPNLSMGFSFSQDKEGEILANSIKIGDSLHPDPIMEWNNIWKYPHLKRAALKRKAEFEKDGETSYELIKSWVSNLKKSFLVLHYIDLAHHLTRHYWDGYADPTDAGRPKTEGRQLPYSDRKNIYHKRTVKELMELKNTISDKIIKLNNDLESLDDKTLTLTQDQIQDKKREIKISEAKIKQLKDISRLSKIIHHSLIDLSYDDLLNIRNFPASNRLISMSNCFPSDNNLSIEGVERGFFQFISEFAALGKTMTNTVDIYDTLNHASELLPTASSYLKEYLRRIVYIGPLREYPERVYSFSGNIPSSVGKSGKYTPDILLKRPDLKDKVNEWFDRFDIGYQLKIDQFKRDLFSLSLVDKKTNCEVSTKDVGFGIGQLLPILVQGILSENKIVIIEQPEIHVHPRLQAELGSFIAEVAGRSPTEPPDEYDYHEILDPAKEIHGNQFIIETHSEHIILRLLRIIRDTTNGELKEGEKPLRPEDVAVIYAKPTEHGTELMELRISGEGEFIDKWPDGFFTEREKELF